MPGMDIRKGDRVKVIAGKDRGAVGRVIQSTPEKTRVLVEGVNRIKKHTKVTSTARGAQSGGIVTQEAPVHVSNVQVVCPSCEKPSRVGHRKEKVNKQRPDGTTYEAERSVRICRRCGKDI